MPISSMHKSTLKEKILAGQKWLQSLQLGKEAEFDIVRSEACCS